MRFHPNPLESLRFGLDPCSQSEEWTLARVQVHRRRRERDRLALRQEPSRSGYPRQPVQEELSVTKVLKSGIDALARWLDEEGGGSVSLMKKSGSRSGTGVSSPECSNGVEGRYDMLQWAEWDERKPCRAPGVFYIRPLRLSPYLVLQSVSHMSCPGHSWK